MVASIRGYTPNYSFKLVNFDTPRWHTLEYANWTQLDGLLLQAGIPAMRGDWQYGTTYFVGDRVFDTEDGALYRCLVTHVSASSGTFADDRALHPTFWILQTVGVPLFRGVWAPVNTYVLGDLVVVGAYQYYLCIANHMSGSTFPPDAGNWALVFDATAAVNATNASAVAAAGSATAAAGSATESATSATNSANSATASQTSATNSANSATASAGSATNSANSATAAAGSATAAATSATNAAASAVEAANQASKLFGTSTTSMAIGLGTQVFTTQADKYFNVGKFLMIRSNADPINFWEYGQVTAYSGTTLTMNILSSAGVGTFANWIIDVSAVGGVGGASVNTQDSPPSSAVDGDLWHETDTGRTFVYIVDASGPPGQWVQQSGLGITSANNVSTAVEQNLTAVQQVQARKNIYAAPFDAMAYSGMQINGSIEVSQERGLTSTTASSGFVCDGWRMEYSGTMVINGAVYVGGLATGFPNQLTMITATAMTTVTGANYAHIEHHIEGYRVSRLAWGAGGAAQPLTLAFWTSHHRTGLYTGVIRNANGTRSYAFTYTQNAVDIAQYNVITIPGCPDGVWESTNGIGLNISFVMALGTTYTTPVANAWVTGNYLGGPGQINAVASTADVFRICGLIILPGIQAPTASQSPFVMRPYDQELVTCMRYFEMFGYDAEFGIGQCVNATGGNVIIPFAVLKRAQPAITLAAASTFGITNAAGGSVGCTTATLTSSSPRSMDIVLAAGGGFVAGNAFRAFPGNAGCFIKVDARL